MSFWKKTKQNIRSGASSIKARASKIETGVDSFLESKAAQAKASRAKWDRRKSLLGEITGKSSKPTAAKPRKKLTKSSGPAWAQAKGVTFPTGTRNPFYEEKR